MIEIKNLSRIYSTKSGTVKALDDVNLTLESTGMVFILGKSGSGKSTLLNVLGGLDKYDNGEIVIKGKSSNDFSGSDFDSYRNTFIGFIFQDYNILQQFTVAKNIGLALELQGKKANKETVDKIIESVDLAGYGNRKPETLSGGQKQRVAIARALIKEPEILMADEPTGALDSNTGRQVFETLKKLSKTKLVLVVSHDRENAEYYGDRIIELKDGKIISDIKKYLAPPETAGSGISIVDNKIVTIKAGHKLTADDTNLINNLIGNTDEDVVISIDGKSNTEFKKFARIDDSGNKESFADTKKEDIKTNSYDPKQFKLIKSKLPYKDSFKIGASSLKAKPIRLIFTILLCVVAFGMFGLADTMGSYDNVSAYTQSLKDTNINYASIYKAHGETYGSDYVYWNSVNISKSEVDNLNNTYSGVNFKPVFTSQYTMGFESSLNDASSVTTASYMQFYLKQFTGIIEFSEADRATAGFSLLAGHMPNALNEIAVSKYIYEHFKEAGYKSPNSSDTATINSPEQLIGKEIYVGTGVYKIAGVIDTGFDDSRYSSIKTPAGGNNMDFNDYMIQSEFRDLMDYGYHALMFVKTGFYDNIMSAVGSLRWFSYGAYGFLQAEPLTSQEKENYYYLPYINFNGISKESDLSDEVYFKNGHSGTLKENEIVLSMYNAWGISINYNGTEHTIEDIYYDLYRTYYDVDDSMTQLRQIIQENFFADENKCTMQIGWVEGYGLLTDTKTTSLKIVGIDLGCYQNIFFAHNSVYGTMVGGEYKFAISVMPTSTAQIRALVELNYNPDGLTRFILISPISGTLEQFGSMIENLARVFLIIGIVFAVFSFFLMFNFIATSISYKKRDIGILRAVGARGSDVFGIFFNESLIITLINLVLSVIGVIIACYFINGSIRNDLGVLVTFLSFGFRQILLMLGISIATAFVSSFLPVRKIAKMRPIDAIKKGQ